MTQIAFLQRPFRNQASTRTAEAVPRTAGFEQAQPVKVGFECCPYCQQTVVGDQPTALHRIKHAALQLFAALFAIVFCVFRIVRLVVGGVLTMIGLVGFGLKTVGSKIVHPDDRRLLPQIGSTD